MAIISAQITRATLAGIQNDNLSSALDSYAWVGIPYASVAHRTPGGAAYANALPVKANGRAIKGLRAKAFLDDYYERIHVYPTTLDLGNIISTQTSTIIVWNAYFSAKTLTEVAGLEEGISVEGPGSVPMVVPALGETSWDLSVTPDGPARLDAELQWVFSGVDSPVLVVTGNRIVAFGFVPDWSEPVKETLAWLTDVLASTTGAEQRRALRIAPRRSFEAQVIAEGRERAAFDLALAGWGAKQWALPIWHDVQWLAAPLAAGAVAISCVAAGRDFVEGGLAMLRGDDALITEAVEISKITAAGLELKRATQRAWPVSTRLYPVRSARLAEQPEMARKTDRLIVATVSFDIVEPCDWTEAAPMETYRGLPVYTERPDESEDLTSQYERLLATLDNTTGLPAVTDTAGKGFPVRGHRWVLQGVDEHSAQRGLLYWLRGRQRACWLPTHAEDLMLAATASGATLTVERVGYARFGVGQLGRQDIRIELADGSVLNRRILSAAEVDDDTETLVLDSDLPAAIDPADVVRISYLALMRLSDDSVEIEHVTDIEGVGRAALTFRGVRDDLEATA